MLPVNESRLKPQSKCYQLMAETGSHSVLLLLPGKYFVLASTSVLVCWCICQRKTLCLLPHQYWCVDAYARERLCACFHISTGVLMHMPRKDFVLASTSVLVCRCICQGKTLCLLPHQYWCVDTYAKERLCACFHISTGVLMHMPGKDFVLAFTSVLAVYWQQQAFLSGIVQRLKWIP